MNYLNNAELKFDQTRMLYKYLHVQTSFKLSIAVTVLPH